MKNVQKKLAVFFEAGMKKSAEMIEASPKMFCKLEEVADYHTIWVASGQLVISWFILESFCKAIVYI